MIVVDSIADGDVGWLGGGAVRRPMIVVDSVADGDVGWLGGGAVRQPTSSMSDPRRRDVFLGGSCGSSRWRDEVAVPILLFVVCTVILPAVSHTCLLSYTLESIVVLCVFSLCQQ